MVYRKRAGRRANKRRPARRVRRVRRNRVSSGQRATLTVALPIQQMNNAQSYDFVVNGLVLGASGSDRLSRVASSYQDYRISRVSIKFMPCYNTFSGVSTGVGGFVPQLMTKMLDIPAPTTWGEQYITALGCRTHEITQRDYTVSFAPRVNILAGLGNASTLASGVMIKKAPWISTNGAAQDSANTSWIEDETAHYGLLAWVNTNHGTGLQYQISVHYQFRKPNAGFTDGVASINPLA